MNKYSDEDEMTDAEKLGWYANQTAGFLARIAELEAAKSAWEETGPESEKRIAALEAENAELRRLGDAMADAIVGEGWTDQTEAQAWAQLRAASTEAK